MQRPGSSTPTFLCPQSPMEDVFKRSPSANAPFISSEKIQPTASFSKSNRLRRSFTPCKTSIWLPSPDISPISWSKQENHSLQIKTPDIGTKLKCKSALTWSPRRDEGACSSNAKVDPFEVLESRLSVSSILTSLELSLYIDLFNAEKIDLNTFSKLTDDDLNRMGVYNKYHRYAILKAISDLSV